ncbi:MAG: NifU N-terminal domain-containing protein [Actinomycetota bacterium]|nr:NifU N-terminal domain-containing protein [Actinomycetota bacterium]
MPDAVRDACRRDVAARGLTPSAVAHLTRDALGTIDFANLAPVKTLLKRFFSAEPWTPGDDAALADLVGSGDGWWHYELDDRFAFEFGWRAGAFRLELSPLRTDDPPAPVADTEATPSIAGASIAASFDGPVVPEATPNPRTIRFVTPPIHDGPSRWYESAAAVDDPRVAPLFEFADVTNVLVGHDFVAVGVRRPAAWEQLLDSVLRVVTREFAAATPESMAPSAAEAAPRDQVREARLPSEAHTGALDRAWRELGALRADQPRDLERLLTAVSASDAAVRQVAARLVIGADLDIAEAAWGRLLADASRGVRRATVDAMVDAHRSALRPLLERALGDVDAWTRWKALRGLVELGVEPSRGAVVPLTEDPDFRVRLETARALRGPRD